VFGATVGFGLLGRPGPGAADGALKVNAGKVLGPASFGLGKLAQALVVTGSQANDARSHGGTSRGFDQ